MLETDCLRLSALDWLLEIDCWKLISGDWWLEVFLLEIDCWKLIAGNWLLKIDFCKIIAANWLLSWLSHDFLIIFLMICNDFVITFSGLTDWLNNIWHSLRLNAEVMARAWHILDSLVVGVKIILQVVIRFFYVPCKKLKKCPKSIKLWLCIRYCTDRLTLGHVRLYDRFWRLS